ncbi:MULTISPECIES: H-type lectin domain-containing protein [Falsihalocynthiibacter]|jgi:hypothetical protein|uniref:H-type lectin domain-containing protein n=1 Tax=Falsihalocynthiibacter TaxID=2854182 RepID=UPI0005791D8E
MRRFQNHQLGIDQGSLVLFSDFQHDGNMWTGEGQREHREAVSFSTAFRTPPVVQISISMWDFDSATNQRGDLTTEKVSTEGFVAVFKTWGDTRIARIRVDWTAVGELENEDDWDVH